MLLLLVYGCATTAGLPPLNHPESGTTDPAQPDPPPAPEPVPAVSGRLPVRADFAALQAKIRDAYAASPALRASLTVDKPLYQPGETVWFTVRDLKAHGLAAGSATTVVQLLDPQGAVRQTAPLALDEGVGHNAFDLGDEVAGGRWTVRVVRDGATAMERPILVQRYEAPRIQKKLDFLRKAYGAGDTVLATVTMKRATGEPIANTALDARIDLDGAALEPVKATTDAEGSAVVRFRLPPDIARGDGLLTVMVTDGGLTESVSRAVPILVNRVALQLFPEGGDLVEGLPGRVYLEARSPLNKPADIAGKVLDDQGAEVAAFKTVRDGRGRFAFTPAAGRSYRVAITSPAGIRQTFPVPSARAQGCVLRSIDDFDGKEAAVNIGIRCSTARTVDVQAARDGELLDGASVGVAEGAEAVVALKSGDPALDEAPGAVRVTVFDGEVPLAERLVYRNRDATLKVSIEPDKERYTPRGAVSLAITTTGADGRPVAGRVALSVVDDTVLSYADDKEGRLLSQVYLAPEIQGTVEEPEWYFDTKNALAGVGLDLVMGTRGWRRFDWEALVARPLPMATTATRAGAPREEAAVVRRPDAMRPFARAKERATPMGLARPAAVAAPRVEQAERKKEAVENRRFGVAERQLAPAAGARLRPARDVGRLAALGYMDDGEGGWGGVAYAPVREFPAPVYAEGYDGPRTDFRQTIHWAPDVRTGKDGKATVTFHTSDAVTSFRARAEAVGGGAAGAADAILASSLPFSLAVKLPVAVTEGDRVSLPVTLTNETDRPLSVDLSAALGELLTADGEGPGLVAVGPRARVTRELSAKVTGKFGSSHLALSARAAGLHDEVERDLAVAPLGFPQSWEVAGEAKGEHRWTVDLGQAVPGTVQAKIQLYPSPVASMTAGLDGMLREPGGCFEQTSSSNYPNVMVMRYLEEAGGGDAAVMTKAQGMIDRGYQRLVGFETPKKGYEWFGAAPAHEALTAYGLVEFADMKAIHPEVSDAMIDRTRDWLLSRRDGKGGFERDSKAIDTFGRASSEVTDTYITWALARTRAKGIDAELARVAQLAATTEDAYVLALATGALQYAGLEAGRAVSRLVALQDADGAWSHAKQSITVSSGPNLVTETTALAVLALIQDGGHGADVREGVAWLNAHRGGFGQWGATQATVLGLSAVTEYARSTRATRGPGEVSLRVNGETVGRVAYEAGHQGAIVVDGFGGLLRSGKNELVLVSTGEDALPFGVGIEYRATVPATHPEAPITLATKLARSRVGAGETVRLTATVRNTTSSGQPSTVARVGIPGGLSAQTWQLEELRKAGTIDFWESNATEVILYFRDMAPEQTVDVGLDLVADVPGSYTGPASSAYLYYGNDRKTWVEGVKVEIGKGGVP
jgi:hypothetical protein